MQQLRHHVRHLRASLGTRLAIVAAPQIFPLVGPLIVGTPLALALALSFLFRPLLPPRGLRLQPIELAVKTVAVRGQGGRVAALRQERRYASLAAVLLLLPVFGLLLLLLPLLRLLLLLLLVLLVGTVPNVRVATLYTNKTKANGCA